MTDVLCRYKCCASPYASPHHNSVVLFPYYLVNHAVAPRVTVGTVLSSCDVLSTHGGSLYCRICRVLRGCFRERRDSWVSTRLSFWSLQQLVCRFAVCQRFFASLVACYWVFGAGGVDVEGWSLRAIVMEFCRLPLDA